jgi:ATP-dependent Lon protease
MMNHQDQFNQNRTKPQKQQENQSQSPPKVSDARTTAVTTNEALNPGLQTAHQQNDGVIAEIDELEQKVRNTENLPPELKKRAMRSIQRLYRMARRGSYSGEFETVDKYIYWITNIPWVEYTEDNLKVQHAKEVMDNSHYGLDTVKNLVLDYLAVMQLQRAQNIKTNKAEENNRGEEQGMAVLRGSSANAPVMLFVGLQGVGKTSIAKSIANAMGREFMRVSLGAIGSVQALRGQSKAFLDAEPGQIIKALVRTGTMNPVILLDEIDKTSGQSGLLNDVMAALLEILDPEQNSTFIDHYIDYPVDLSKVFFICTANNLGSLSAALLDRMEVIRFTSYTDEEKTIIAKNYSFPTVLKNTGLTEDQVKIQEEVWPLLVRPVGYDAGLRQLERNLATLVRAAARKIVEGEDTPIVVTPENLSEYVLPDQGPLS